MAAWRSVRRRHRESGVTEDLRRVAGSTGGLTRRGASGAERPHTNARRSLLMEAGFKLLPDKGEMRKHRLLRGIGVAIPHSEIDRFVLV